MPNSDFQPAAVEGHEGSPQTAPVYAYSIRSDDSADAVFLTSWERSFTINGLPARFGADTNQEFTPTHITHGEITRRAEFDRHSFDVAAKFDTRNLSAFFITASTTPMTVEVIRIAKGTLDNSTEERADFDVDCYVVQSGLIQNINLSGEQVVVSCVPVAFHMESTVPRIWFNRTCQWALYGTGCGLTQASYVWESQIASLSRANRSMVITSNPGGSSDYFYGGIMIHNDTLERFTVLSASTSGNTNLVLGHWIQDFEVGDQVQLYPGCNRTINHCVNKFGNGSNFGGFSQLPDRNPTIHGV